MHGDEVTGMILMLRLIDEFCTSTDTRIQNILDNVDLFIFPCTNPDGTYHNGNNSVTGATRANGNNVDLNRHFPDFDDGAHPDGASYYQDEAQWMMDLAQQYLFTMGANYHGGAEVINYPWDTYQPVHPDDDWWQYVSREYAQLCQAVNSSYMCSNLNSHANPSGITNGYAWYTITGSRQDYMNYYGQCREVTVECSNTKTPSASQLPNFWNYNHNAMLTYIEECLNGVHGVVKDATTNQPIEGVTVTVLNHDALGSEVSTHTVGDFHRPIKGGNYTFKFTKEGYCNELVNVTVADGANVNLSVFLTPEGNCPVYLNCYEPMTPSAAGSYVMGYLNGTTLIMPTHNNGSANTTSVSVTNTYNGFSVVEGTSIPKFTLTAYNSGRYYISYNVRYLNRSNNGLAWGTSQSSSGRWYVNSDGIYQISSGWGSSTYYYLYYNNGSFALSTDAHNNIKFYQEGDCAFTMDITKYSAKDHYYLIASPIGTVSPTNVTGMLSNNYDLYYFDQNGTDQVDGETDLKEWRNYEVNSFNLMPGKGYLYANSQNVTLIFSGMPYYGNGKVTLSKTGNVRFSSWNLVGNPFAQTAYITRPFYTMNETGTEIIAGSGNSVEAMEGIFVIAESDGETMTFYTSAPAKGEGQIVLNVSQGTTTLDRAIVRMGEGDVLPKFMLNENNTKVFITQDAQELAVAHVVDAGVIPVSFKAAHNGEYSICVNVDNTEVNYLHLIDNMTGADIDILQTPNYRFNATKDDYTSRFKLVFATGSLEEDSFAFFTNGNWIISNDGEAMLQVIDINGRVLSSEEIHGSTSKHIEAAPGVYMLRLIKGDDVKVQKIVVR